MFGERCHKSFIIIRIIIFMVSNQIFLSTVSVDKFVGNLYIAALRSLFVIIFFDLFKF